MTDTLAVTQAISLAPGMQMTPTGAIISDAITLADFFTGLKNCERVANWSMWALGDILCYGEARGDWGEMYSQALGLLDGVEPVTPWAAKFSLPFCVATALRYKDCTPSRFTEETILDETTLALAANISFDTKEDLASMYPAARPSRVMVRLHNGATDEATVD